jgi:hypothetical protein
VHNKKISAAIFFAGFMLSQFLWYLVGKPTESEYLRTVTSHYFKTASQEGFVALISFEDCKITRGAEVDSREVTGECQSAKSNLGKSYYYFAALNSGAGIDYWGIEETK